MAMTLLRRRLFWAPLALVSVALAAQDGTLLRRTLVDDATDEYSIETSTEQSADLPGMGEQTMTTKLTATYAVKAGKRTPEKSEIPVDVTYTVLKADADGPMAAMMPPTPPGALKFSGTLSDRGRITRTGTESDPVASLMSGSQSILGNLISIELPEKAVKVGDSWKVVVPKSQTHPTDEELTVKLTGDKEVDGKAGYTVSTEGTITTEVDLAKMLAAMGNPSPADSILMKGSMKITSEGVVEKATGKTLRLTTKTQDDMKIEIPSRGMTVPIKGKTTMVVTAK